MFTLINGLICMNSVEMVCDGARSEVLVPEMLSECSGEQLCAVAALRRGLVKESEFIVRFFGWNMDVVEQMTSFEVYSLMELVSGVVDFVPDDLAWREWMLPTLNVGGKIFYGPDSNFGNVSWGEFVYVDQCMMNGLHQAAIAAMFRPERENWTGETDRRIPFTIFGTTHRFDLFENMGCDSADEGVCVEDAVVWNYIAMRSYSIERQYSALFPYYKELKNESEADNDDAVDEKEKTKFSWVNVHRNLLGDNIQDEERYLALPVHTVLSRLNERIIESKKKKR